MKYLKRINENFSDKEVILTLKNNKSITISFQVKDGRITNINNERNMKFPYKEGQTFNIGMETWCCNNGYLMNSKNTCPEEKVFGIKKSLIPQGHPFRSIYPHKFK